MDTPVLADQQNLIFISWILSKGLRSKNLEVNLYARSFSSSSRMELQASNPLLICNSGFPFCRTICLPTRSDWSVLSTIYQQQKKWIHVFLRCEMQITFESQCPLDDPRDLGSIPGRVIPKTLKMVLDTSLLNIQHYKKYISRVKWSNPGKGVALSPTPQCCSY